MVALRALAALCVLGSLASAQIIIDTDAGSDDAIAVALLLANHQPIEAVTVVNGMAHVAAGAQNMLRLLEAGGAAGVPVYEGRTSPLRGSREFPAAWRTASDDLLVGFTAPSRAPRSMPASEFLVRRLRMHQPRHIRILALGPLTNIAEALRTDPDIVHSILEIVIMGGAIHGGNAPVRSAEWNMYLDPLAAQIVFRSGVPIRLMTLDATKRVPIGADFVREFNSMPHGALGDVVQRVLDSQRDSIAAGQFYAWDPLAAAALLDSRIVRTDPVHIDITDEGRTVPSPGPSNVKIGAYADAKAFRRLFMQSFSAAKAHPW